MENITYIVLENGTVRVLIGKRVIGIIKKVINGYQYFPKGSKVGGEILPTIDAVQASLESED